MNLFVSYARRDNPRPRLLAIDAHLQRGGHSAYIDDLHYYADTDRCAGVIGALMAGEAVVVVGTRGYLHTAWTRFEFELGRTYKKPLLILGSGLQLQPVSYSVLKAELTRPFTQPETPD